MKGIIWVAVITMMLLLIMPPLVVRRTPASSEEVSASLSTFSVKHSDSEEVDEMDGETLLLMAVMGKLPPDAPQESIKAVAVAEYSRFCYQSVREEGVVTTDTPFPQTFTEEYYKTQWGEAFSSGYETFQKAVSEVMGQRLLYKGEEVMALTHTRNGGWTESYSALWEQDVPYLQAMKSAKDTALETESHTVSIPKTDALKTVSSLLGEAPSEDMNGWFEDAVVLKSGVVKQIQLCGKLFSGLDIAKAFSLPSAAFSVQADKESLTFTVTGQGHFVGMSLYGAQALAKDGKTYLQILKQYYTDVEIQ